MSFYKQARPKLKNDLCYKKNRAVATSKFNSSFETLSQEKSGQDPAGGAGKHCQNG
jgi:hypothetical protein